jgi:hypothetical protein
MVKKLHTGLIVFDWIDVFCISFSVGGAMSYLFQKYNEKNSNPVDPIVNELKQNSKILKVQSIPVISTKGDSLNLPLVRGGKLIKGISLSIKNKKFAAFLKLFLETKRKRKLVKLLQAYLYVLNQLLTYGVGVRFAVGGSLETTQIILISVSGSIGGFLAGQILKNPLAIILLPLSLVIGRGIEEIPNPQKKCEFICKAAEDFHNRQYLIEMKKLIPLEKIPLLSSVECVKDELSEELSIMQRFKLRQLFESAKVKKRVEYYHEFIKRFPECSMDLEEIAEKVVEKIPDI